jgi:hypothetical protein
MAWWIREAGAVLIAAVALSLAATLGDLKVGLARL